MNKYTINKIIVKYFKSECIKGKTLEYKFVRGVTYYILNSKSNIKEIFESLIIESKEAQTVISILKCISETLENDKEKFSIYEVKKITSFINYCFNVSERLFKRDDLDVKLLTDKYYYFTRAIKNLNLQYKMHTMDIYNPLYALPLKQLKTSNNPLYQRFVVKIILSIIKTTVAINDYTILEQYRKSISKLLSPNTNLYHLNLVIKKKLLYYVNYDQFYPYKKELQLYLNLKSNLGLGYNIYSFSYIEEKIKVDFDKSIYEIYALSLELSYMIVDNQNRLTREYLFDFSK